MGIFSSYKNNTDEELIQLFVNGKNRAFEELYNRYSKRLLHFMYKMLNNNEEMAQDLLQDIFLKIVEYPKFFDVSKKFKPWIFTVAANQCRNKHRKPQLIETNTDETLIGDSETGYSALLAQIDNKIFKQQLKLELNKLSNEHKTVFVLRYKEDFTVKEIAEIVGCSEGTVKSRIHYAIKKMAVKLEIFHPLKTS